jgi:hypothetical protein
MTVPQIRSMIAEWLNGVRNVTRPTQIRRTMNRRLKRNEEARSYHWHRRKRLLNQRLEQRT